MRLLVQQATAEAKSSDTVVHGVVLEFALYMHEDRAESIATLHRMTKLPMDQTVMFQGIMNRPFVARVLVKLLVLGPRLSQIYHV